MRFWFQGQTNISKRTANQCITIKHRIFFAFLLYFQRSVNVLFINCSFLQYYQKMIDADVIERKYRKSPGEVLRFMTSLSVTSLPVKRTHQGGYCAISGSSCTHPREPLRSLPVAMVLVLLYYILYYCSSSTKCTGCACERDHFLFRACPLPDT